MNSIARHTSTQKLGNCSLKTAAQTAKAMIRLEMRNYFIHEKINTITAINSFSFQFI
jgi:hypothetical protein